MPSFDFSAHSCIEDWLPSSHGEGSRVRQGPWNSAFVLSAKLAALAGFVSIGTLCFVLGVFRLAFILLLSGLWKQAMQTLRRAFELSDLGLMTRV